MLFPFNFLYIYSFYFFKFFFYFFFFFYSFGFIKSYFSLFIYVFFFIYIYICFFIYIIIFFIKIYNFLYYIVISLFFSFKHFFNIYSFFLIKFIPSEDKKLLYNFNFYFQDNRLLKISDPLYLNYKKYDFQFTSLKDSNVSLKNSHKYHSFIIRKLIANNKNFTINYSKNDIFFYFINFFFNSFSIYDLKNLVISFYDELYTFKVQSFERKKKLNNNKFDNDFFYYEKKEKMNYDVYPFFYNRFDVSLEENYQTDWLKHYNFYLRKKIIKKKNFKYFKIIKKNKKNITKNLLSRREFKNFYKKKNNHSLYKNL